jgi:hypothetical protein
MQHGVEIETETREEDVRALARRLKQDEVVEDPTKHYDGPTVARAIAVEWADLRGGFFIGAKTLVRMDRLTVMHVEESLRTEADLLQALETIDAITCEVCDRCSPQRGERSKDAGRARHCRGGGHSIFGEVTSAQMLRTS